MNTEKIMTQDELHPLFEHMHDEYGLTLLHDQLCDIVAVCRKIVPLTNEVNNSENKTTVFDYCENDEGNGGVGCNGDGLGDCKAVMKRITHIPADIKSRIEAEYAYTGLGCQPDDIPKEVDDYNSFIHEARKIASRYYYIGRSEAGNVDWEKIEDEFVFHLAECEVEDLGALNISQWFKSRLQGVKVDVADTNVGEIKPSNEDELVGTKALQFYFSRTGKIFAENSNPDLVIGYVQGWKECKQQPAPAEQGEVMNPTDWFYKTYPTEDMKYFASSQLMSEYSQYVLSFRGNEAVEFAVFCVTIADKFDNSSDKWLHGITGEVLTTEQLYQLFKNKEI